MEDQHSFTIEHRGIRHTVDASELMRQNAGAGAGAMNWTLLIQIILEGLMKYFSGSGAPPQQHQSAPPKQRTTV